jgi:hypothetical protein
MQLVGGKLVIEKTPIKFPENIRFVSHKLRPAPQEETSDYIGEVRSKASLEDRDGTQ